MYRLCSRMYTLIISRGYLARREIWISNAKCFLRADDESSDCAVSVIAILALDNNICIIYTCDKVAVERKWWNRAGQSCVRSMLMYIPVCIRHPLEKKMAFSIIPSGLLIYKRLLLSVGYGIIYRENPTRWLIKQRSIAFVMCVCVTHKLWYTKRLSLGTLYPLEIGTRIYIYSSVIVARCLGRRRRADATDSISSSTASYIYIYMRHQLNRLCVAVYIYCRVQGAASRVSKQSVAR